jgi:hypothetical protein
MLRLKLLHLFLQLHVEIGFFLGLPRMVVWDPRVFLSFVRSHLPGQITWPICRVRWMELCAVCAYADGAVRGVCIGRTWPVVAQSVGSSRT